MSSRSNDADQKHKSAAPSTRDGKPRPEPVVDRIHSEPLAELVAGENDPWLTASTLAEYAYCPRAGLLTHEGSYSDPEVELPALGLMYWYESERVEEAYAEACYRLFWMVFGLVLGVAVVAVSPLIEIPLTMLLLVGGFGYWVYRFCIDFRNWAAVGRERIECRHAPACEPDAMSTKPQPVNWWGLLRADFSVERPVDSLRDNAWRLSGKPRRFLQKGDLVIPVHRINSSDGIIKPQHIVRVMTHCHLVSSDRGAVSPYAIILFGRSHEGVTVPNTLANREQFYEVLRRARVAIAEVASGERLLPRPAPASPCKTCPHSRPRLMSDLQPTMKDGEALDPYLLVDRKGERWHSDCGDRFGEKALHKRAERLVEIGYPPTD